MKTKRRSEKTFQIGRIYDIMYSSLVQDLSVDRLTTSAGLAKLQDVRCTISDCFGAPPHIFKAMAQLKSFHKRLILNTDTPFKELSMIGYADFLEAQKTFKLPPLTKNYLWVVLKEAREIVADILGEFDYQEYFSCCAFGKKAALGLPRESSFLDNRIEVLSGSFEQFAWFQAVRSHDIHLMRATRKRLKHVRRSVCRRPVLKGTAVPKSFKAVRIVFPDTVLGGFLSRGLGILLRSRLEANTRIDLKVQQHRHKRWARRGSINGKRATIDESRASDSFVWKHMELLMPVSWHEVLKVVRTRNYRFPEFEGKKEEVHTFSSYMLMGSGHTFPLQTILFYALSEAVRRLTKTPGTASVYGDDIIVPTGSVLPLITTLERLGFTVNREKSFFEAPDIEWPSRPFFRESCGGDYYKGVDVRPYMPEDTDREVKLVEYVATLHKAVNGLLERWDPTEVPLTVGRMLGEIESVQKMISIVPRTETDLAGIHENDALEIFLRHRKHQRPIMSQETGWRWKYWALREKRKKRQATMERIYYWYSLWLKGKGFRFEDDFHTVKGSRFLLRWRARKSCWSVDETTPILDGRGREPARGKNAGFTWKLLPEEPVVHGAAGS